MRKRAVATRPINNAVRGIKRILSGDGRMLVVGNNFIEEEITSCL